MLAPRRGFFTYMISGDADETTLLSQIERALAAGIDLVQLRRRNSTGRTIELLVKRIAAISPDARKRLLVNDRLDLALEAGGIHLPANGLPVASVRRVAPGGFLIGCSTHDREEAVRAAREGADFVVFGPVFATPSKPGHPGTGLDVLAEVSSSVEIPVIALGGITPERSSSVAVAGARGVAGISMFEDEGSLRELVDRLDRRKP